MQINHLARHLSEEWRLIVDDLDLRIQNKDGQDDTENEADDLASAALIPKRYWPVLDAGNVPKATDVVSLATKLKIHPAPIAGRIRFQHNNYRILSKLIGNGQVRNLFPEYAQETATWT